MFPQYLIRQQCFFQCSCLETLLTQGLNFASANDKHCNVFIPSFDIIILKNLKNKKSATAA